MNCRLSSWPMLASALVACGLQGCLFCCHKPCGSTLLPSSACAPCRPVVPAAPACAPCTGAIAPASPLPTQPPAAVVPQAPAAPTPVPMETRSFASPPVPLATPSWQPSLPGSGVRLTVPQPVGPATPHESARLNLPESAPPPPAKPLVVEERSSTPPLPSGIAQFNQALDGVATGLKPLLEGLDWLQKNGYQTVLHLPAPGEDDAADRRQVEKRGMKYVSLAFSPDTLAPNVVDEFKRLVEDPGAHPLFVYDKDGMVAGGLWYLYFRTVLKESDEAARTKAARLGLQEEHGAMWSAIQKFLGSTLDK